MHGGHRRLLEPDPATPTSTIGVMQFVVQLAQERMAAAPTGAFTP
jgi:hypothetical protein